MIKYFLKFALFFLIPIKVFSQGPVIVGLPFESDMTPYEVTINWKTFKPSQGVIKFGTTSALGDSIFINENSTSQTKKISNLQSATIYYYQVGAIDSTGIRYSPVQLFSTASLSSGAIYVYFSKSANTTVSLGENATTTNLSEKLIERFNNALYSIDLAVYSFSGTVGNNIATALVNAKQRGVQIRVIIEEENSNSTAITFLKSNGIPVINDKFDPVNNGYGLMHNKFSIIDFRDKNSAEDDWITTGSWNATDPGTNNDAQNFVMVQDQALANAYTIEFEEMWGSNTNTPNSQNSKFNSRKSNNTPHRFLINNTPVELYFSPSDGTTSQIISKIQKSNSSVYCALLSFTKDEISEALVQKHNEGKKIKILMDNSSDTGNEFANLQSKGIDVLLKKNLSGLLHHKYAIIDSDKPSENNFVITGSHNWSNSAENSNSENTIIFQSKRIANLFLQEFKSRYIDAGGKSEITKVNKTVDLQSKNNILQNYPNPFNSSTRINYNVKIKSGVSIVLYDLIGNEIQKIFNDVQEAGNYSINFNAKDLPTGIYFYRLIISNEIKTGKMHLIK